MPSDATGVLVNVTAAGTGTGRQRGGLAAYGTVIGTSTVYFAKGESIANRALVALAPTGPSTVYAYVHRMSASTSSAGSAPAETTCATTRS